MRPIHVVHLDKARPAVVLTRELVRPHLRSVTVAPITSAIRLSAKAGSQNSHIEQSARTMAETTRIMTSEIRKL